MKTFLLSEINQHHLGEWQTTESVYYCSEETKKKIENSIALNDRNYVIREIDAHKFLYSKKV